VTIGFLFWLLMVIWLVFGAVWAWPREAARRWEFGGSVLTWVLFALLGWAAFGFPIRG